MPQRWKRRPEGSNWGDFGPDDQRGRMNLITPKKVLEGIAEVKEGIAFYLSLPLDYPGGNVLNPRRHPPRRFATLRGQLANYNFPLRNENPDWLDVVSDDSVLLHTQYSTQWDSFAHVGQLFDADGDGVAERVYYNGWRAGEHVTDAPPAIGGGAAWDSYEGVEARVLGIENLAVSGVQGRAVLIDLHRHFGREPKAVGYDDLMRVIEGDGVEIAAGDIVALHTGFGKVVLEQNRRPTAAVLHGTCSALDGRDDRLLRWITDSGLAVLVADNYAVEVMYSTPWEGRPKPYVNMPLHNHCLFKLGIHLGELWYLSELAAWLKAHDRSRFLLTAPPLRLTGAVGSPATPVATV
jgi:kynurenine formamidase